MSADPMSGQQMSADRRPHDVVVLGASGLTGRLVAAHLARRAPGTAVTWAAAGRDAGRVRAALADVGTPPVLVADVEDPASLAELARSARVVLNLAGPYTARAEPVIAACVAAGTSYVDLTGETPFVAQVVQRWDAAARRAGVKVVQVAGFEALPFDVAVLLAAERAGLHGDTLTEVDVAFRATATPRLRGLTDAVSGGTLASLVAVLTERGRLRLSDPALLVPDDGSSPHELHELRELRRRSPLRLAPRAAHGRVLAPLVPAAFINPPVIHRTAALLAQEQGRPHRPFRYREGTDLGPGRSPSAPLRWLVAGALAAAQGAALALARLPPPVRRGVASRVARVLPPSGSGPSGPAHEGWRWQLDCRARTAAGRDLHVRVEASGHPGYAATAAMVAELGMLLATEGATPERAGCLTPALAVGTAGLDSFAAAGVTFTDVTDAA